MPANEPKAAILGTSSPDYLPAQSNKTTRAIYKGIALLKLIVT